MKEGASSERLQSGLQERWWSEATECDFYLRNVQELLADGQRPCERRFNLPLEGPIISLRTSCISSALKSSLACLWVSPFNAVRSWTGEVLVVDTEDLKAIPPSEIHVKIQITRSGHSQDTQSLLVFPCRTVEVLQEGQPLYTAVSKAGRDFRQELDKNSAEEKRGSPRCRSRCRSSTRFLEHHVRLHLSESRCSENETPCSEGRFTDPSELH